MSNVPPDENLAGEYPNGENMQVYNSNQGYMNPPYQQYLRSQQSDGGMGGFPAAERTTGEFDGGQRAERDNWNNSRITAECQQQHDRGHSKPQHDNGHHRGRGQYQQRGHCDETGYYREQGRRNQNGGRQGRYDQKYERDQRSGRQPAGRSRNYGNHGYREDEGYSDRGSSRRYYDEDPMVTLSKGLSWILRHAAQNQGFKFMSGGFLNVDEILKHHKFKDFTLDNVREVVKANDKQRFFITRDDDTGKWKIRANQGHTLEVEGLDLKSVESAEDFPTVVHGTHYRVWETIKTQGLRRMGRNHIHFAPGEPGQDGVISGMRSTCEVLIFLDLEAALKDGLKFFLSANNVLLSTGNEDGFIFPCYFANVIQRYPRSALHFDNTIRSLTISPEELATETRRKGQKNKNKNKAKEADRDDNKGRSPETNTEKKKHIPGLGNTAAISPEEVADEAEARRKKKKRKRKGMGGKDQEGTEDQSMELSLEIGEMFEENNVHEEKTEETCVLSADKTDEATGEGESSQPEPSSSALDTVTDFPVPDTVSSPSLTVVDSMKKCQEYVKFLTEIEPKDAIGLACFPVAGDEVALICIADEGGYVYVFDVLTEPKMIRDGGPVHKLFSGSNSQKSIKVLHGCALTSKLLFDSGKVMLKYTPIYDTQIAFQQWKKEKSLDETDDGLFAACKVFHIELESVDAWDASEDITNTDWTTRPLTHYMKLIIKRAVLPLLKIKEEIGLSDEQLKGIKKLFYEKVNEYLDPEEVKKVHDEQKKIADQAKKKDPNAQSAKPKEKDVNSQPSKGKSKKGKR